ncbi:hypothetical protein ACIQMY_25355 [Streptomyces sp. NPDC091368]|uniref:hypothetical protein n=1 Tax=Streptomyces sp. NPDC091368 TaxID=3365993 RepID=UPI0037F3FD74
MTLSSSSTLTVDRLLTTPLPELLAEANAEIVDAPSEFDAFEGVALKPYVGPIQVFLPKARSAAHRDAMARLVVGQLFGTDLSPLPASLDVRTFGGFQ